MSDISTDVVIVGCGAAGSIAGLVLASAGTKVIALEAGPAWEVDDFVPDELESYAFKNYLGPKWNAEKVEWLDRDSGLCSVDRGLNMMNGIGGTTLHYAAHAWRFHPEDFEAYTHNVERYGKASIPEGSTVVDWPIGYSDLERHYDLVEHQIGVSGAAGVLSDPDTGAVKHTGVGNPFEGPRSREYPMPPLREHRLGQLISKVASERGLHPFIGPTAINSVPYKGRSATNYCGFCLGYACRIAAKGSPNDSVLPDALWTGNLDIMELTEAIDFEIAPDGRIGAVVCRNLTTGDQFKITARMVVLSAYTFETVRLLLCHNSDKYPAGLSNNAGQVGKHFMTHRYDGVAMIYDDEFLNRFAGPQGQRIVIDDFNADNFDHSGLGFIQGGHIIIPNEWHPIQDTAVLPPSVPLWGHEYRAHIKKYWNKTGLLLSNIECLPYAGNFLQLSKNRFDDLGRPLIQAVHAHGMNEQRIAAYISMRMEELARGSGARQAWPMPMALVPSQHDAGGTRMGEDPSTSVVDPWGRSHEVPNLFIFGPSAFPTTGGLNPSLTLQALAWRGAEHILGNML